MALTLPSISYEPILGVPHMSIKIINIAHALIIFFMRDDRLNLTQGVQVILKIKSMKSMNFRKIYDIYESKKKIYEIYEYFQPSKARFHILLEARRADREWASTIRPEGSLPQAHILENMYLSLVSMHLSIINCCFYHFWPILSHFWFFLWK